MGTRRGPLPLPQGRGMITDSAAGAGDASASAQGLTSQGAREIGAVFALALLRAVRGLE